MLDIKTTSLISIGLFLFLSYLMYIVYRGSPNIKGPKYWIYNSLLNAIGQLLFLWYSVVPNSSLLIISNTSIAFGDCLFIAGLWVFKERRIKWKILLLLTGLMMLQTFVFTIVIVEPTVRRVSFSIILTIICMIAVKELFEPVSPGLKQAFRFNGYLFLLISFALLIRGGLMIYSRQTDVLASSLANNILYNILIFAQVGITFGSMLMVNYRIAGELSRLNEGKTFLFSILAHDLRGPMMTIHRFMEYVDDKSLSVEEREDMVNGLKGMTLSTHALMENLLDWVLNESNKIDNSAEWLKLDTKINDSLQLHAKTAELKNIEFIISVPDQFYINVNEKMISAVFRNLIANAIKFSYPGSEVIIEASQMGKYIKLLIKDQGVGIPEERLNSLFSLNHTKQSKGTSGESGTGLGLIICKSFIEKNSGKLTVNSIMGKGTQIEILLPGSSGS